MRRFLRALLVVTALAYPLALIAIWLGLAHIGERWWLTTVGLYLPRLAFVAPLPVIVLALAIWGPRKLLLGQVAAAAVILFPLMGLRLSGPGSPSGGRKPMRVLSYNVNYGWISQKGIIDEIKLIDPDVIVLQAIRHGHIDWLAKLLADYHTFVNDEFVVASRYPILATFVPDEDDAGWIRATLDTPAGMVDVFDMHPLSPRPGLEAIRGNGLREGLESGRMLRGGGSDRVERNTDQRSRQVTSVAAAAAASRNIVVIAGDTNLPDLSPLLRRELGRWQDGFLEVGRGFGYTFPAHRWFAWMRIDRILSGPELRFLRFGVGARRASDHYLVWADLERR